MAPALHQGARSHPWTNANHRDKTYIFPVLEHFASGFQSLFLFKLGNNNRDDPYINKHLAKTDKITIKNTK